MPSPCCTIDGCGKPRAYRDHCGMHHMRIIRYGDPNYTKRIKGDDAARLWSHVDRRGPDECWPFTGSKTDEGYGKFRFQGKKTGPHRAAYVLTYGPIPDGFEVDHVRARGCIRTDCCNPAHLEAVPPEENWERSNSAPMLNKRKTHCKHGHEFTPENIKPRKDGGRACRTCSRARNRARKAAKRAARLEVVA